MPLRGTRAVESLDTDGTSSPRAPACARPQFSTGAICRNRRRALTNLANQTPPKAYCNASAAHPSHCRTSAIVPQSNLSQNITSERCAQRMQRIRCHLHNSSFGACSKAGHVGSGGPRPKRSSARGHRRQVRRRALPKNSQCAPTGSQFRLHKAPERNNPENRPVDQQTLPAAVLDANRGPRCYARTVVFEPGPRTRYHCHIPTRLTSSLARNGSFTQDTAVHRLPSV